MAAATLVAPRHITKGTLPGISWLVIAPAFAVTAHAMVVAVVLTQYELARVAAETFGTKALPSYARAPAGVLATVIHA